MTCQHCAAELPPYALFCGECGRSVSAPAVAPPVVERPIAPASVPASPIGGPRTAPPPDAVPMPVPTPLPVGAPDAVPWSADGPLSIDSPPESTPSVAALVAEVVAATAVEHGASPCPQCGTVPEPDDRYCAECGAPVPSDTRVIEPITAPVVADAADAAAVAERAEEAPAEPAAEPVEESAEGLGDEPAEPPDNLPAAPDVESTRIVPRGTGGARFVLQFSTGESYTVLGSGLAGRNPHPEPGEYVDHLVAIVDPGRSVSKTHVEFGQQEGVFWVSDRHSGNGSIIREPGAEPRVCEPGRRYPVVRGTRIDIGEQFVVVS